MQEELHACIFPERLPLLTLLIMVRKDSGINPIEDLRGKTIGAGTFDSSPVVRGQLDRYRR